MDQQLWASSYGPNDCGRLSSEGVIDRGRCLCAVGEGRASRELGRTKISRQERTLGRNPGSLARQEAVEELSSPQVSFWGGSRGGLDPWEPCPVLLGFLLKELLPLANVRSAMALTHHQAGRVEG